MEIKEAQLLQRIEEFSMDAASVSFPFSARLAKENSWSAGYAKRVIEEYKRFVFLGMVAGHPVSPSDAVDQVWHLHLTYTQSYWKEFCGQVLERPFHHQPTKGGMEEEGKFEDWYTNTLASYRNYFGAEPSSDIWPAADSKVNEHPEFVRVDARNNWVIPKWRIPFLRQARWLAHAAAVALLAVGCQSASEGFKWPWELRGPDFLKFYFLALCVAVPIAAVWRRALRKEKSDAPPSTREPDPYVAAYLNGGEALVLNAAVVNLAQQKALEVTENPARITVKGPLCGDAHPVERALHESASCGKGDLLKDLRPGLAPAIEKVIEQARKEDWVLCSDQAEKARWWPLLLALTVPALGLFKLAIGLSNGRPVGFLIMLLLVSTVGILIGFARRPRTTHRGDKVLRHMQEKYASFRGPKVIDSPTSPDTVPLALGLFGMAVLADSSMADMRKRLGPPPGSDGCGSSCGGGGGDGGGCGGGCGGCGGCGGD